MPAEIGYSQIGQGDYPSPSIWGDCPMTLLSDRGLGRFKHVDFLGAGTGTLAAILDVATISYGDALKIIDDSDLVDAVVSMKASELGGWLDMASGATASDAIGLVSEPFGKFVRNSGKKLWFEAYFELGALADQAFFVGLVEEANQSVDVIATGEAGLITTDSFIGGQVLNDDTDGFDIVHQKDGGTKVEVLATATQATAIPLASRFNVAAAVPFKYGLRFDGKTSIYHYVNGYRVATQAVDSTLDQSNSFCAMLVLKTGTGAAQSFAADWVRYAYQERS